MPKVVPEVTSRAWARTRVSDPLPGLFWLLEKSALSWRPTMWTKNPKIQRW